MTPSVPATQGIGETGESGIAYNAKLTQAVVTMVVPKSFIKQWYHRLFEMYFEACKDLYTYPIKVYDTETDNTFPLNYGGASIDVSKIERLNIKVSESPASPTRRGTMIQEAVSVIQYSQPGTLQHTVLAGVIGANLAHLDDASRQKIIDASAIEEANLRLKAEVDHLTLQVSKKNLEQQLDGKALPPPPPPKLTFAFGGDDMQNPAVLSFAGANGAKVSTPSAAPTGPPRAAAPQQ
jgi:hypothetical protein